jgi:hypothetical protein
MSQQSNDTTGVHRFEKNNYFYGKLLTVRDMAAEQAYHSGIQRTHSRHVTDWGVICGLDVSTTRSTDEESGEETLEVTVSEGLALDRCGRLLSVADEQHRTVALPPVADGVETDTISVYVAYDECFTDPVPAAKMENACEEDCKDNRIIETAEVTVEPGAPTDAHKSVAEVTFPSATDLSANGTVDRDAVLARPARSYYENEPRTSCPPTDDGRILVGTLSGQSGDWANPPFTYGPLVYTNDLLYDALVNHATDFGNPHDVVASITGVTPDESGNVDITADDPISVTPGDHSLNLSFSGDVGGDFPEEYRDYLLEKSLQCECNAFADLAARFDMVHPGNIAQTLETHLSDWRAGDADYLDVFGGEPALLDQEKAFHGELTQDKWSFIGGADRYLAAVQRLEEALAADPTPLPVAIAQIRVCDAASCLTGDCLDFDRFPFAREELPRPFSHGDYVLDSKDNIELLQDENGMRLGLEETMTVLDFPPTSHIEFDMFSEVQWDDVILHLTAVDRHGEEFTIFEGEADTEWDLTHRFSATEPDLTRLRIALRQEVAGLRRFCRR